MPFGSRAKKLDRILTEQLAWGPAEAVDPSQQLRIPITAIGGPSVAQLAATGALSVASEVATGYLATPYRPPIIDKDTGRTIVLDPIGLRHVDIPRGVTRLSSVHLTFAVRWVELGRIVLELLHNPRMNMTQTRIVMVPVNPDGFRAAHPDMAPMNGAARVGPGAWMLSLGMSYTPDQNVVTGMLHGLAQYAPRLFSGHVDTLEG